MTESDCLMKKVTNGKKSDLVGTLQNINYSCSWDFLNAQHSYVNMLLSRKKKPNSGFFAAKCWHLKSKVVTKTRLTGKFSAALLKTAATKIVRRSKFIDPPPLFVHNFSLHLHWSQKKNQMALNSDKRRKISRLQFQFNI